MLFYWSSATSLFLSRPRKGKLHICLGFLRINLTSFSISAHFAFFFSFFAFKYSFLEAASSFLFFTEFWRNSHGETNVRKPLYQCTSTWAWTVVVPLEGNLSKPRVDTKIPLQWKLCQKSGKGSTDVLSHLKPLNFTETSPSALISSILASWYCPSPE